MELLDLPKLKIATLRVTFAKGLPVHEETSTFDRYVPFRNRVVTVRDRLTDRSGSRKTGKFDVLTQNRPLTSAPGHSRQIVGRRKSLHVRNAPKATGAVKASPVAMGHKQT